MVILIVAAIIRLGWVIRLTDDPASLARLPDQVGYLELGTNLLEGRGLNFVDPRFADVIHACRMPGYPAFIVACGAHLKTIRVVQALLDASCVLAVYLLGRRWIGAGGSLIAAAFVALNPFLVYFCGLILSETLFTAMLVWGMALLTLPQPREGRSSVKYALSWWLGALLLVGSIYVRPSALMLPIFLGLVSALVNVGVPRPYDRRWMPPVATLMLIMTVLALLPWAWRNHQVLGKWIWTTTNDGITLYDGFHPDATGASNQSFVTAMPQLAAMDEIARSDYLSGLARQFVRENPRRSVELGVIKAARTLSPVPLSSEFGGDMRLMVVALAYMIPLDLLAIAGLWLGRIPRPVKVFLLIPLLYFVIIHAASVGSLRYRIPSDVPIAVLAGLGAVALRGSSVEQIPTADK